MIALMGLMGLMALTLSSAPAGAAKKNALKSPGGNATAGNQNNSAAPKVTIRGFVYKNSTKASNAPVRGATVKLKPLGHRLRQRHVIRTGAEGHFSMNAPPGRYAVIASKRGAGRASIRTVLTNGETLGELRLFLHGHHHSNHHRRHRHVRL